MNTAQESIKNKKWKKRIVVTSVLAILIPFTAQAGAASYENHVVTLTGVPEGAGKVYLVTEWNGYEWDEIDEKLLKENEITVKATIEAKEYKAVVHLYALPNEGYDFVGFYLDEDGDGVFNIKTDSIITFTDDAEIDLKYTEAYGYNRSFDKSPAIQVFLTHESPNEYSGAETSEENKAKAEAAAESDWKEFGCLNHFFAVFEKKDAFVTIGERGVATFCSKVGLDFSAQDSVTAYVASEFYDGIVTLTPVTNVPANTGVIVLGNKGTYEIPIGNGEFTGTNYLKGTVVDKTMTKTEGSNTNFIFAYDTKIGLNFFAAKDGTTLKAGKAYLSLPTASLPNNAQSIGLRFLGTTGIFGLQTENQTNVWYSVDGRRLEELPTDRGIYSINGKKVFIR